MAYIRVFCLLQCSLFVHMILKNNKQNNRKTGDKGEDIACFYLQKHGFIIQERNYLKRWGEIDIIAIKDSILHFIEVKSTIDKSVAFEYVRKSVGYRPEENVNQSKVIKLRKMIQTFVNDRKYGNEVEFKFHIITVIFNSITRKARVTMIKDIIL